MSWWIMTSGILSLVTVASRVFLGGAEVPVPVQSTLALAVRPTMAVIWHDITAER